jgi:uncharacterized protein DUF4232
MTTSSGGAARLIAAAAVVFAVTQVTACGSATPGPAAPGAASATGTPPASSTPAARTAPSTGTACANAAIQASLATGGAAAGTAYYTLRFTNITGAPCSLTGYPGASFLSGVPGHQIGSAAERNPLYPAVTVVLGPQQVAHAVLGIAAAANYPASRCHPATAHALRVFPPGLTAPIYVRQSFAACAAQVVVLTVSAVRAGIGGAGA